MRGVRGLDRAKADLERGDARTARERLKGWIVTYPYDSEARCLLAQAYRDDGQPTEAGRWGYLIGPAATSEERRAFERHAFAGRPRITKPRLRRLLRCDELTAIADDEGRAILELRADGLFDRLRGWISARRAQRPGA